MWFLYLWDIKLYPILPFKIIFRERALHWEVERYVQLGTFRGSMKATHEPQVWRSGMNILNMPNYKHCEIRSAHFRGKGAYFQRGHQLYCSSITSVFKLKDTIKWSASCILLVCVGVRSVSNQWMVLGGTRQLPAAFILGEKLPFSNQNIFSPTCCYSILHHRKNEDKISTRQT